MKNLRGPKYYELMKNGGYFDKEIEAQRRQYDKEMLPVKIICIIGAAILIGIILMCIFIVCTGHY